MSWLVTGTEKVEPTYGQDQFISNVSLLLKGNGTNGSTTITDSSPSPKTVTAVGNAQISTAQSKFGGASILLDGAGDYLQSPSSADFTLGTGDFTLECWLYPLGFAGSPNFNNFASIFDYRTANVNQVNVLLFFNGNFSNRIELFVNGTTAINGSSISVNQWSHVALSRSNGVTRLFINGTQAETNYTDTNNYTSSALKLGGNIANDTFFHGYMDEIRITKGIGRYAATFTPSATPFPNI